MRGHCTRCRKGGAGFFVPLAARAGSSGSGLVVAAGAKRTQACLQGSGDVSGAPGGKERTTRVTPRRQGWCGCRRGLGQGSQVQAGPTALHGCSELPSCCGSGEMMPPRAVRCTVYGHRSLGTTIKLRVGMGKPMGPIFVALIGNADKPDFVVVVNQFSPRGRRATRTHNKRGAPRIFVIKMPSGRKGLIQKTREIICFRLSL